MKWNLKILTLIILLLTGCGEDPGEDKKIIFGVSADYPPLEYVKNGRIVGFDIDLANLIAKELGLEAEFKDMQFASILPAIGTGHIDAGISAITITEERAKNFDLSNPYYNVALAAVFKSDTPIHSKEDLIGKSVACQIGTTQEIWLKDQIPSAKITSFDNNNQAIELLKSGRTDAVIVDAIQGMVFSQENPGLGYKIVDQAKQGCGIVVKKGSDLLPKINEALKKIEENGEMAKLKSKWFGE